MKRIIFSFTLLVCSLLHYYTVNAQISIGIKGGYTNAWPNYGAFSLPEDAETDINGFNFALLGYKQLFRNLSLGIEPGLVRRGAACVPGWSPSIAFGDSKLFLDYVELPIALHWQQGFANDRFQWHGKVGYGLAYLLSAYAEELRNDELVRTKVINKGQRFNLFDHGIHTEIGLGMNIQQYHVFISSTDFVAWLKKKKRVKLLSLWYET